MNTQKLPLQPIVAVLRHVTRGGGLVAGSLLPGLAFANPTGAEIIAGQIGIHSNGNTTTVTQNSQNAIVNWQTFSVDSNEYLVFNQLSSSSAILNRVIGGLPSNILGNLSANGRVFIINPQGVMFGQGARVDVGALVATTMDIGDADFMAGRYHFVNGQPGGRVDNAGLITAADGGFVVLAADQVRNSGLIAARVGDITLASGSAMTLNLDNEGLVNFSIDGAALSDAAGVANLGELAADGGRVLMSAQVARQLVGTAVNNSGRISANAIAERDGQIVLSASGGDIMQAGVIEAHGGAVEVRGDGDVTLASGSLIDAGSGSARGGDVRIVGAGDVDFLAGARIDASGVEGGFVELSGYHDLRIRGDLQLGGGTLLIDPTTVTIAQGSGQETANGGDSTVYETFIEDLLRQGANVYIAADEAIHIADLSANGGDGSLDGTNAGYGGGLTLGIGTSGYGGAIGDYFSRGDGVAGGGIFFDNTANAIRVDGNLEIDGGYSYGALSLGTLSAANVYLSAPDSIDLLGSVEAVAPAGSIYVDGGTGTITTHAMSANQIGVYANNGGLDVRGDMSATGGAGSISLYAGADLDVSNVTIDAGFDAGNATWGTTSLNASGDLTVTGSTLVGTVQAARYSESGASGDITLRDSTVNGSYLSISGSGGGTTIIDGVTVNDGELDVYAYDGGSIAIDNATALSFYVNNNRYYDTAPTSPEPAIQLGSLTATAGDISIYGGGDVVALDAATDLLQASGYVSIYAGQSYYYDSNGNYVQVGGMIDLGAISGDAGISLGNGSSRYYGYGTAVPGSHDVRFGSLSSSAGDINVVADRDVIVRDTAHDLLSAFGSLQLEGQSITIGAANGDRVGLALYGGTLNAGALTGNAGNGYYYGSDVVIELRDLVTADTTLHATVGSLGPIRVVGGPGSVQFEASSGMSLSGLDIDAGNDGNGTRGQIDFSSDFGSLEIRDSVLTGDVSALLYGYDTGGGCQCYGGTALLATTATATTGSVSPDDVLRLDKVSVDGDVTLHSDGGQAIDIGTLDATGALRAGVYGYAEPSLISARDVRAGSIELGNADGYALSDGGDILIGALTATAGDVDIAAAHDLGVLDGASGNITASGGIYLSAGNGQFYDGTNYLPIGGNLSVGDLQGSAAWLTVYGGALNAGRIDLAGSVDYYDAYIQLGAANGSTAQISTLGPITVSGHAGNIRIESSGDLDIASIGRLDAGSGSDGYGGTTLGSVSIGGETGVVRIDALDVLGDLQIAGSTLTAHTDGGGVTLNGSGSVDVYGNVAAPQFTVDAGTGIYVSGDIDAGTSGSVALRAHDGELSLYGSVLNTRDLELQANTLSLGDLSVGGILMLTANTGAIDLSSAQASTIDLHAATDLNTGDLDAGSTGSVVLAADTGVITTGNIATHNLSVTATTLAFGDLAIGGDLVLHASGGDLDVGAVDAGSVMLTAAHALNASGAIDSAGAISLGGSSLHLAAAINGSQITISGGTLTGMLDLTAGGGGIELLNTASTVDSAALQSAGDIDVAGTIDAAGALALAGQQITLGGALDAASIELGGSRISGLVDAQSHSGGLHIVGLVDASTVTLQSAGLLDVDSRIDSSGAVILGGNSLQLADAIHGLSVTISGGDLSGLLDIGAGSGGITLSNSGSSVSSAALTSAGDISITALTASGAVDLDAAGHVGTQAITAQQIDIAAGSGIGTQDLDSGGAITLISSGGLIGTGSVDAAALTASGDRLQIGATTVSGALQLDAGAADIDLLSAQAMTITLHAATDIVSGALDAGSSGTVTLSADSGTVTTADITAHDLSVSGSALDLADLLLGGDLQLTARAGDLQVGSIDAASVTLSASDALSVAGSISSSGATKLDAAALTLGGSVSGSQITVSGGTLTGMLDLDAGAGGILLSNSTSNVDAATLHSSGAVAVDGTLSSVGATQIDGASVQLGGAIDAASITISGGTLGGTLDLDARSGALTLGSSSIDVDTAQLAAAGDLTIEHAVTAVGDVALLSGGSARFGDITASNIDIAAGSDSTLAQASTLNATGTVRLQGPSFGGDALQIDSGALELQADLLFSTLGITVAHGLNLQDVALAGDSVAINVADALALDGTTIAAATIDLQSGAALTASGTTIDGNVVASATGSALIADSHWQGGTATVDAASLTVRNSSLAYDSVLDLQTHSGALVLDSSQINAVQQAALTQTAVGDVSLQSAADLRIVASDVSGEHMVLQAAGDIADLGEASAIDAGGLRAEATGAIDLAASRLSIGSGSSGVAGDAALLDLLAARAPDLVPDASDPNGFLRGQRIALGTLDMSGDYLSLNADAIDIGAVGSLPTHLLVQIRPLAPDSGIAIDDATALGDKAGSTSVLDFADAALFAPFDASLAFGGSGYAGDIDVAGAGALDPAQTNFLFMTSGHVNGQGNLRTNGQVIVLAGITQIDMPSDDLTLPILAEIEPDALHDGGRIDSNGQPQDEEPLISAEDAPGGDAQCR